MMKGGDGCASSFFIHWHHIKTPAFALEFLYAGRYGLVLARLDFVATKVLLGFDE